MTGPDVSVVVPTRDRPGTLESCLRTVLAAADDATEILVHDNSTDDRTERLIARMAEPRVRYERVRDLAMTDNWEAALAAARGRWITVLGDDDGMMPFAVRALRRAVDGTGADVVAWRKGRYCWPDRDRDAGKLKIPAPRPARWIDGMMQLRAVLADPRTRYGELPMIYNAFVSRAALDRIVRPDGRSLGSRSPDVYSGAAIAATTSRFLRVGIPLTVNGLSGGSNGVNSLTKPAGTTVATDFAELNERAGHRIHPAVPDVRSLAGAALESCLSAIDALSVPVVIDPVDIVRLTLEDAVLFSRDEAETARARALAAVAGRRTDEWRVARLIARWDPMLADADAASGGVRAIVGPAAVQVDGTRVGVEDIAAAVRFAAAFYDELPAWLVPDPNGPPGPLVRLRRTAGAVRGALRAGLRSDR